MIVAGAGWYLRHQKAGRNLTPPGATENKSRVTSQTEPDTIPIPSTTSKQSLQGNPSLVGTWRSGNFAYTFFPDGTHAYVGAIVTSGMQTTTSEKGDLYCKWRQTDNSETER